MTQKTLYTGGGVSLSPIYAEGRTESRYIRLIADEEGRAITNGDVVTTCVDVPAADIEQWTDCEMPDEASEEATEANYQNDLRGMVAKAETKSAHGVEYIE